MAPGRMSRAFFCNSGSGANETLIKLVWYFNNLRGRPEKKKFLARAQLQFSQLDGSCFHGPAWPRLPE